MFRPLTREKQQLSHEECIQILTQIPRGVLSLHGDDGYPYGVPIDHWFCEEDGCLYFHGGATGHKIDSVLRCDKVSYCVMDAGTQQEGDWALWFRSVIVFGRAQIITDPEEVISITRRLSLSFTKDAAFIEEEISKYAHETLCIRLTPEHICGKRVHEA